MANFPVNITSITIVTSADVAEIYAELTHDFNKIHLDSDFAKSTVFGKPIAHGTMALNLIYSAVSTATKEVFYISDLDIRFSAPCYVGQKITGILNQQAGPIYSLEVRTDDDRVVLKGSARLASRASL